MLSIGLMGGTFNPIHNGHLNLALELKERAGLSEIWIIPASISPFRLNEKPLSNHHRLNMIERAIAPLQGFRLLDIEMKRSGPSYTIDTVLELMQLYPHHSFTLLLGEDAAQGLAHWKRADVLIQLLPILVGARKGPSHPRPSPFSLVEIPLMDIESTTVRNRLKKGLYCGHLLPAKVLEYIDQNQLYFNGQS